MTLFDAPYVKNLLLYIGSMFVGALAAGLGVLMVQLAGTDPIVWRPVLAAALGPIVTGLLARQLTKGGREDVGNLVTQVGVPRAKAALEVEVIKQQTGQPTAITTAQLLELAGALVVPLADEIHGDVTDELERRMKVGPAAQNDERRAEGRA